MSLIVISATNCQINIHQSRFSSFFEHFAKYTVHQYFQLCSRSFVLDIHTLHPIFVLMLLLPLSEPPSPPRSVMAEGTGPQSITVTFLPPIIWNSLTDIIYNLTYQSVKKGSLYFLSFGSTVERNMAGMEERLINGLEEDTAYIIIVSAINDFGSSPPSIPVQVSTKAFTSEPVIFSCRGSGKM